MSCCRDNMFYLFCQEKKKLHRATLNGLHFLRSCNFTRKMRQLQEEIFLSPPPCLGKEENKTTFRDTTELQLNNTYFLTAQLSLLFLLLICVHNTSWANEAAVPL